MNLSASEPVRSRHRMDNLIAASRSQEGIKGALATGTLEKVLRIYENTAPHFLSETEDEVCTFDASEDSNRPSLSIPVDLVRAAQCLRNLCSRQDNVIYVHERGATSWIKLVVRRLAHISPPSLSVRNSDESNISGSKDDIFVKLLSPRRPYPTLQHVEWGRSPMISSRGLCKTCWLLPLSTRRKQHMRQRYRPCTIPFLVREGPKQRRRRMPAC
jgi:hypothetical protein